MKKQKIKKTNKRFPNIETITNKNALRSSRLSGLLGFFAIILITLYYAITTYLPYSHYKDLLDVKQILIKMAIAEQKYMEENNRYAPTSVLFGSDINNVDYAGYSISTDVDPDLSSFKINAKQLNSARVQYPNCNTLTITPKKLISYDSLGEISSGCW